MDYRRVPSKVINERKLNVIYNLAENTHKAESEERIPLTHSCFIAKWRQDEAVMCGMDVC